MTKRNDSNPWFGNTCILIRTALILLTVLLAGTDLNAQTWQRMKMEFPEGYGRISRTSARFAFASKDIGWLATTVYDSASLEEKGHFLFKTTNGGDNWFIQRDYGVGAFRTPVFALDTNYVWVGLTRSSDGGNTWEDSISMQPKRIDYTEVFFFDSLSGVAVGTIPGTTTDGGRTWTSHDSLHEVLWPRDLSFPTRMHGWAACDGHPGVTDVGSMLHTSDGGVTWEFQTPPPQRHWFSRMYSVEFLDSLNGFAIGSGEVLVTTNGGDAWGIDSSIPRAGDISFLSDRMACLSGGYGIFWYSEDRGRSWTSDTTEYKVGFRLFPVSKEGYMFAWGTRSDNYDRELLRGDFRSLTMVEEPGAAIRRTVNTLTVDTWPQPISAGGLLNIRIDGEAVESYHLTLFDLLGRKRAELQASAGKTATIDAGALQLTSGVYLLRAVSVNGAQATRLIALS